MWKFVNLTFPITVCSLFFLNAIFLTYRLADNPPGFFIDESVYGFEAYTLLHTGGYSANGEFLPRTIKSPGRGRSRNHFAYVYLIVPLVALLGLSEFSVRLASVSASLATLCVIYFLIKDKVGKVSRIAILLWWPFVSWVFLLSRMGMEQIGAALFYGLSIFVVEKLYTNLEGGKSVLKDSILVPLVLSGLFYIAAPGRVLSLGMAVVAVGLLLRKRIFREAGIVVGLLMIAYALSLGYILDGSFFYRANELTSCTQGAIWCFLKNILSHADPRSYFANTYVPPDFAVYTHSITGTSLLPKILAPFLAIGIVRIAAQARSRKFWSVMVFYSAFMATIPASLTIRGFDSYRSAALLPIITIFIAFGFDWIVQKIKGFSFPFLAAASLACFVLFGYSILHETRYLFAYQYNTVAAGYSGWQYGYSQVLEYFKTHYNCYERLLVTPQVAYAPETYIRFFDPRGEYPKVVVGRYKSESGKVLYALRKGEFSLAQFDVKAKVFYPNGVDVAFYIGEEKTSQIREKECRVEIPMAYVEGEHEDR